MLYAVARKTKQRLHQLWKLLSPGWGLSRYVPFVHRLSEWIGTPPRPPSNAKAFVSTGKVNFELYVSHEDPNISPRLFAEGIWERNVTRLFQDSLRESDSVLDLGAHFGYYSVLAAKCIGKTGKVYAFEPDDFNFELLTRNIQLNQMENRIIPIQKAAGDRNEMKTLSGGSSADSSDRFLASVAGAKILRQIDCVRVEDYLSQAHPGALEKVRVIKMDIEGYEPYACRGMESILAGPDVFLFTELNHTRLRQSGSSARDYLQWLQGFHFKVFVIDTHARNGEAVLKEVPSWEISKEKPDHHLDLFCIKEGAALPRGACL